MKNLKKTIFLSLLFLGFITYAQNDESSSSEHQGSSEHHSMKGASRLTLGLGHTHVSKGKEESGGKTQWLALASWSINYDYWLSDKWALGLQNDIILESFVIEDNHNELIERKTPIAVVPVAIYKPGKHLSLLGGVGGEFSHGHNLTMTRLGAEYGFHLPGNWEVGTALVWDGKWNYYNSWGLAFTVSKIWACKKHH